ncbi:MAG: hypothetical protein RR646_02090 [Erysipelotrichaceae bacterium]
MIDKLAKYDEYYIDKNIFRICDTEIQVLDKQLFKSLERLPMKKRNILLMFYFLEMNDAEIAKYLNIRRVATLKTESNH